MERRYVLFITLFTVLLPWTAVTASNGPSAGHTGFIANNGQVLDDQGRPDPRTLYYFQGADLDVSLRPDGFAYVIWTRREATVNERTAIPSDRLPEDLQLPPTRTYEAHRIAITFERASSAVQVEADEPRAGYFNYYTAGLPAEGVTRVPHFTTVTYRELYPHIDVVFHLTDRDGRAAVKYDLIVRPGGDLSAIRMRYEGAPAALTPGGLLVLDTPLGPMQERVPESWYQHGQRRSDARVVPVALDANVFGFRYDGSEATPEGATLVIDPMPTLSWEATFDEEDAEVYSTSTFDAAGYVYAAGARSQPLFGGTSTVVQGPSDVLLAKYDGAGQLMWLTYMGGGGAEGAAGIGTLPSGDVVIGGQTDSPQGMATVGAWQAAYGGGYRDGFIARFNTAGLRVWSMYYGGNYFDHITDLACDASGRIVVTGSTESAVHMASPNAV
ncbi:MAG TPA: hypothetical protein VHL57_04430, partial [Flavobacteriales bacterium]|nr:hypothetical protein [Flavobacteriales bacterium]